MQNEFPKNQKDTGNQRENVNARTEKEPKTPDVDMLRGVSGNVMNSAKPGGHMQVSAMVTRRARIDPDRRMEC